jgi:hypothetical protein
MRVIEHRNIDHAQLLQLAKMLLLLVEPQEPSLELEAMTQLKKEVMLVKDFVKASWAAQSDGQLMVRSWYRNYEGDLLYGKCGPAETCPSYTCDRLTFVSGCIVEATNEDITAMEFTIGFQEAGWENVLNEGVRFSAIAFDADTRVWSNAPENRYKLILRDA